jgi:sugar lactone lactonase YvrE
MFYRSLRTVTVMLLHFALLAVTGVTFMSGSSGALFPAPLYGAEQTTAVIPLPPGCIDGTPTGGDIPVCCIKGLVMLNGEAVSGAAVTIQSSTGSLQVFTQRHNGDEDRPYYRAPLSTAPISATRGSIITVTVQYAGLRKSVQHLVQDGSQQVDLVLNPSGLSISPGLVEQPTAGKFNDPRDVAVSSRGNLYVLDRGNLRVQVYQPDGTLLNFPKWQKRFGNEPGQWSSEVSGIAIDPRTDTVYIADHDNRRIARYTAEGNLLGLWDGNHTGDGIAMAPFDVAVDGAGYVYAAVFATTIAGDGVDRRLYRFDPQTDTAIRWGKAGQNPVPFGVPYQLTVAPSGEVYVADSGHHQVYRFDAAGQLQPFTITFAPALGNSPPISNPIGIALDQSGTLYLADFYPAGNGKRPRILAISGNGQANQAWNYPTFNEAMLDNPHGMALGGNILYLGDRGKNRVARLNLTADFLTPWGGADTGVGQLNDPRGIVVAPAGTPFAGQLLVADCGAGQIAAIQGTTITHRWTYTDVNQSSRWCPRQLAFDSQNRLLVMDNRDFFLARYQINGNQLVQDGGPWQGTVGNSVFFSGHVDFAVDSQNRLYIADDQNRRVAIYTIQDNQTLTPITTFVSITATDTLTAPQGIAINEHGENNVDIYLADTGNNRLLKLNFTGSAINYVATWGNGSNQLTCPNGQTTVLDNPKGLLAAPDGHLYVADQDLHRVLKLTQSGACVQILGQGSSRAEPGKLSFPADVTMDAQGILYVSNRNYNGIARFAPPQSTLPLATITHVSANAIALQAGDTLEIIGQGQASLITETITAFLWSSTLDGALNARNTSAISSTLRLPATALQLGLHQMSLVVTDNKGRQSPPVAVQVRRIPDLPPAPVGDCQGESWAFLLYLVGDFSDGGALRGLYDREINRLSQIRNPCVRIAIQVDGPADGVQPTNFTQRVAITPGAPLVVTEMSELSMDQGQTLNDFVRWGQAQFPTQRTYLAIANHGQGIRGIGWDKTSGADEFLTPREIADALTDPRIVPVDILHLDACSMGLLDVVYELRHSARRLITSQYIGWSFFAYSDYLRHVQATQLTGVDALGSAILAEYARLGDAANVPYTLSLLNPARAEVVKSGLSALSAAMIGWVRQGGNSAVLRALRQQLDTLDSNGDLRNEKLTDAYVDLQDFLLKVMANAQTINNPALIGAAEQLMRELTGIQALEERLVIAHRFASRSLYGFYGGYFIQADIDLAHTHGVSIYFPPETLAPANQAQAAGGAGYSTAYHDYLRLETPYQDFTRDTRWEDLLYTLLGEPQRGETLIDATPPLAPVKPSARLFLPLIRR